MKNTYLICLDPGHGKGCVNASPDGRFLEDRFAMDLARRIERELLKLEQKVIFTRDEKSYPELMERVAVSNNAKADLFLSIHSNASGGNTWTSPRGLCIYTSSPGAEAERNIAMGILLNNYCHDKTMVLHGDGSFHQDDFTVLCKTEAPALLVEFGFHTNKEDVALLESEDYKNALALSTAAGIYEYFSDRERREGIVKENYQVDSPSFWAKSAWERATALGIVDGLRPRDGITREEFAVVLGRLGFLKG